MNEAIGADDNPTIELLRLRIGEIPVRRCASGLLALLFDEVVVALA
jgi:hypothetical protein